MMVQKLEKFIKLLVKPLIQLLLKNLFIGLLMQIIIGKLITLKLWKKWECKIMGVMVRDGGSTDKAVPELVFLSITIELQSEGLRLYPGEYLENKLKQREVN